MEKIKVCHFSSVHKTSDVRIFLKECSALSACGYDVTLVANNGDGGKSDVKIIPLDFNGGRALRMIFGSYKAYKLAKNLEADIYHFHDPELLPYGLLLKFTTNAKVIYDSHECYAEDIQAKEWLPSIIRRPIAWLVKKIEDFAAKKLDMVIGATPHISERFSGVSKNVVTVNNYPLRDEFSLPYHQERYVKDGICYVGAISRVRGILPLLDAFDFVPPSIKFRLAGTFAGRDIEELAKSHRNWARVDFLGQVNRSQIAKIYQQSFAGIVNFLPAPNHIYSQPNKLFEYMSAGLPVICSNFPLWKSVIENGQCGICVPPDNGKEIAKAINRLAEESDLRAFFSRNGTDGISHQYNWESESKVLCQAYERLVSYV